MRVTIGFEYVLLLEWLSECDERTGARRHEFLPTFGFQSELVVCHRWGDVQQAVTAAPTYRHTPGEKTHMDQLGNHFLSLQ
jgi:hypothetical protein